MYDFDDLLTRRNGFQNFLAHTGSLNFLDEFPRRTKMNVRGQQGFAYFRQSIANVFFAELAHASQVSQRATQFIGKRLKHDGMGSCH